MPRALTIEEKVERAEAKAESRQEGRERRRSAFNGTRGRLTVNKQIPGYHLHIFNDTKDGRIQQALDTGYEFVSPEEVGGVSENVTDRNTDLGGKVRFLVGSDNGEPLYAYLMKIKQEWYEEDKAELAARNDRTEAAIKRGQVDGVDNTGFYNAGIKLS